VHSYLRSLGVDPRTFVVQRGQRNYAGPNCPGKAWNCTKAKRVIQMAGTTITNRFVCRATTGSTIPDTSGTNADTNTCVLVQVSQGGLNEARCFLTDIGTHVPNQAQSCVVTQTNTTGRNSIWATQDLRQYDTEQATGHQQITVTQRNGSGNNAALIDQNLIQVSDLKPETVTQVQEAKQSVDIHQTADTGTNSSDVKQVLSLRAVGQATGAVSQSQNTANDGPNTLATINQTSGSGANSSSLDQYNRLEAQATSTNGPVNQSQGSTTGGLYGDVHQVSSAPSTTFSHQDEDQIAHATTPTGTLTQTQIGPLFCCGAGSSVGNDSNSVTVNQTGHQESDGGSQLNTAEASCRSSGSCGTHQHKDNNVDSLTVDDGCEGSTESPCTVDRAVVCGPEGCETFPVEEETGSPDSAVTKGVRNISAEQAAFTPSTTAFPGDTIEYQIVYTNTGTATAHSVTLTDAPPGAFDFASCTGGCTDNDGTLTWALGDVPADESRTVTFRGAHADECGTSSNTATADTKAEEPVTSNEATVSETCIG
jgi:uncharacterized repeat protein (TIGR01451 family)